MARNGGSMGIPACPNCATLYKLEGYFAKMGNFDLEDLSTQADCADISEVKKSAAAKQERRTNRMGNMENVMGI